jgi:hypothetical protein
MRITLKVEVELQGKFTLIPADGEFVDFFLRFTVARSICIPSARCAEFRDFSPVFESDLQVLASRDGSL